MDGVQRNDVWTAGELYEPYVGRWSALVAREFVDWLAVPDGADWLDVGCGTGALMHAILERARPRTLRGVDRSPAFLEHAKARLRYARVQLDIGDATSLAIDTATVDAAVTGLVLNFVPDPSRAIAELVRVVRPGGVVAAYVWDYAERMELMRYFWDAATQLDPAARELDEGRRFPLCRPEPLRELFVGARLRDVDVRAIDVATCFRDFDDYWSPFLGGQGPAPGYVMTLSDERRRALRDALRSRLPIRGDGAIDLVARAWAVRGTTRDADAPTEHA